MKKCKRTLALVFAVIMLMSVYTVFASALSYEAELNQGSFKFIVKADKTEVNPGDVITFSFFIDDKDVVSDLGGWQNYILYNDTQLSPASTVSTEYRVYTNDAATWIKQTSTINPDMPKAALDRVYAQMTEEEKAYYNHMMQLSGVVDSGLGAVNTPGSGWDPSGADVVQMTMKMKVSEDVQPGDEIWFCMHEAPYQVNMGVLQYCGGKRIPTTEYDFTQAMVKLTVAEPAAAGPVVEKDRAQVKMTATSATTVADAFTFRVISKITDADWDTYFASTGTDDVSVNAIQKLGFVAYKGTEGFNMDTAKAVAMGTATDANYEAKYTDYVQKVDESSDAYFGARIEFTSAETRTDVTYVGVVEYTDAAGETAYAFYPAEYTAALESNFDAIAAAYLAQYPYAG